LEVGAVWEDLPAAVEADAPMDRETKARQNPLRFGQKSNWPVHQKLN